MILLYIQLQLRQIFKHEDTSISAWHDHVVWKNHAQILPTCAGRDPQPYFGSRPLTAVIIPMYSDIWQNWRNSIVKPVLAVKSAWKSIIEWFFIPIVEIYYIPH